MEKRLSVNFLLGDAFLTLLLLHCIDEMMWLRFWECWAEKKKWKWSLVLIFSRSLGWWWFGSYDMTVWTTECKAHKFCRLSCCSESWFVQLIFVVFFCQLSWVVNYICKAGENRDDEEIKLGLKFLNTIKIKTYIVNNVFWKNSSLNNNGKRQKTHLFKYLHELWACICVSYK